MFRAVKRLIDWTGSYRRRLYLGFVYSFFYNLFTALPVLGAVYGLHLILADRQGLITLTTDRAFYMLGFMLLTVAGRFWFGYLRAVAQESIGYELVAEQRIAIGEVLKRVSLGFFRRRDTGEITAAVTTDLSFMELFGMKMIDLIVNGYVGALVIVVCLLFYNGTVVVAALAGLLGSAWALQLLGGKSRANAPVQLAAHSRLAAAVIEYIRGMPVVKAFKQAGAAREGIRAACRSSKIINIKIEKNYVPYNCLHLFCLKAASVAVMLAAALFTLQGDMTLPTFLLVAIFSFSIFDPVKPLNEGTHILEILDQTQDKLRSIVTAEPIDKDGRDIILPAYDIEFRNVTFAYEAQPVLKEVSFLIPANTTTAIVGPSGSGKSTICSLMARFYDVNQGSVLIGGVNVKELTCDSLMKHISMVFQRVYLFQDTVLNNIRFGKPAASLEEVVAAARQACCHEFISKLPQGYETVIGEGGSTLSGGEKQRISIARAILKDAPVVILDEATASVDPENEHMIQQAIGALVAGKTMVIIAHRLATIQNADQILVVDDGRIVQRGTHAELSRQEGVYRRFLSARQAAEGWRLG